MKTKRVPITIMIDVPENCDAVAVNHSGEVIGLMNDADPRPGKYTWKTTLGHWCPIFVSNWKDTLTKIKEDA